jgi:UDP-N-acetylglucosamine:LPS N-acetylglucosamine transferase
LLRLSDSWKGHEIFYITTKDIVSQQLKSKGKVYIVGECNRQHPLRVLAVLGRCARAILHEKPQVVISTGAAAGCMACFWGKLFGARVAWIDSITNVDRISLSGRLTKHIADLFIVQWPELTRKYKNVKYIGYLI